MTALRLEHEDILAYQANRFPYLLIDVAEAVVPGVSAAGYKYLSATDWFFACHFPGDPNMPAMLQIEALVQMTALAIVTLPGNKGKVCYLTNADGLKFRKKIVVGDRLNIDSKVHSFKRGIAKCSATGHVGSTLACQADFNLVVPSILNEFKVATRN